MQIPSDQINNMAAGSSVPLSRSSNSSPVARSFLEGSLQKEKETFEFDSAKGGMKYLSPLGRTNLKKNYRISEDGGNQDDQQILSSHKSEKAIAHSRSTEQVRSHKSNLNRLRSAKRLMSESVNQLHKSFLNADFSTNEQKTSNFQFKQKIRHNFAPKKAQESRIDTDSVTKA